MLKKHVTPNVCVAWKISISAVSLNKIFSKFVEPFNHILIIFITLLEPSFLSYSPVHLPSLMHRKHKLVK